MPTVKHTSKFGNKFMCPFFLGKKVFLEDKGS